MNRRHTAQNRRYLRLLRGKHDPCLCEGEDCVVHNPSNHHMLRWPLNWRTDRYLMERICPHGIGHPDPDHMTFLKGCAPLQAYAASIHGCDGCCAT